MNNKQWRTFLEKVINDHIRERCGEIVTEECQNTWVPELERKLKSFV